MSVRVSTTIVHSKNGKKGERVECFGCEEILEENHAGIQCAQSHHLCMACSANLVALFIAEPNINLPPRCMICKIELNPSVFERQLTPYQHEKYTNIMLTLSWSKDCLKDNEELIHCPFCSYAEIRVKSSGAQFMFCKHKDCEKTSCLVCLHEVPTFEENYNEDDEEEYEDNMEEIEKHFKCLELSEAKKTLELAIEHGQKVPCPVCGLAGMKDDACTHMTCPECQTSWCYFCGLKESDCDKREEIIPSNEPGPAISRHNFGWENNPKRCPMYLTSICDIDESWPDDEYPCLEYFHHIRSIKYLRQAYEKLGPDIFQQLNEQFSIIDACGFTLDDIEHGNIELIDYENHGNMSEEETDSQDYNVDILTADEEDVVDPDALLE